MEKYLCISPIKKTINLQHKNVIKTKLLESMSLSGKFSHAELPSIQGFM